MPIPAHPGAFVAHFRLPATYIYPGVCGSFMSIPYTHASLQPFCHMGTPVLDKVGTTLYNEHADRFAIRIFNSNMKEFENMKHTALVIGKEEIIHQVAALAGMRLKDTDRELDAVQGVVYGPVAKCPTRRRMRFGSWALL